MDDLDAFRPVVVKDPLEPPEDTIPWIYYRAEKEGEIYLPTPISISITGSIVWECPPLMWFNFDVTAHKMKLTNTGFSVFLSAGWLAERPYLYGGILKEDDKYIFSQIHFHWGHDMTEGSDHVVDGVRHPMEMQVAFFNSKYITPDEAFKHLDGVVFYCYIIKYGVAPDPRFDLFTKEFPKIREAQRATKIKPLRLSQILLIAEGEYFAYFGEAFDHPALWIVARRCMAASIDQVNEFRKLLDPYDVPNRSNYRPLQETGERNVYLVNPKNNLYSSPLPVLTKPPPSISILSPCYYDRPSLLQLEDKWLLPSEEPT